MSFSTLSAVELAAALVELPDWQVVLSTSAKDNRQQQALYRNFKFASFEKAMHFMAQAVPMISQLNHHPRWENNWCTVSVWLTTWDAGHQISSLDVELAQQLEALRKSHST